MSSDPSDNPRLRFHSIRHVNPYGEEFWSARDLMPLLVYYKWERFEGVIERAKAACRNLGQDDADHFARAVKVTTAGKGARQEVKDCAPSRLACYLVAMNGDAPQQRAGGDRLFWGKPHNDVCDRHSVGTAVHRWACAIL
jgi:hypothetical protein